ncbi:DUF4185 domain-containing protein [Solihabitans fulvus]|uniref:DUF4185 domain-containing protein n=1 Tax=Solihabitans fulvus TaxID=1892852 RepID=A0A5B2XWA3_9PSEU|nr:DUF4185 domain-containing protein [Solihabitans fulvus]KAA2267119.1 DUF4185 domain-containing protein [Solihabitans fulvus]
MRHDDGTGTNQPAADVLGGTAPRISRSTFLKGAAGAVLGAGALFGGVGGAVAAAATGASSSPRSPFPAGYVKDLTGNETARFGFTGTDLGFTAKTNHGYCISIFGDTFDQPVPAPTDTGWRSPVGLRQSNGDIQNGIRWDNCIGGDRAKKMIPYDPVDDETARNVPGQPRTEIPNDLVHLPDGRYIMTTFGVRDWADPTHGGIPSAGGSWRTWYSRMWTSTETHAENWERTWNLDTNQQNMDFWNAGEWSHFQNNSMIMWPNEPFVYIYGTNEGRWRGGGIHLMRVPWDQMWRPSAYQFWGDNGGWDWRQNGPSTPILSPTDGSDAIGEISAQVIDGQAVLSYLNGRYGAVTVSAPYPTGMWTAPKIQVTYLQAANLYAPVVHPYSTTGNTQLLVSQWITQGPGSPFYGVRQWSGSLNSLRFAEAATAERLVVTSQEPAHPGHQGPLAPQLQRLPLQDRIAILSANAHDRVSRDDIAAVATGQR